MRFALYVVLCALALPSRAGAQVAEVGFASGPSVRGKVAFEASRYVSGVGREGTGERTSRLIFWAAGSDSPAEVDVSEISQLLINYEAHPSTVGASTVTYYRRPARLTLRDGTVVEGTLPAYHELEGPNVTTEYVHVEVQPLVWKKFALMQFASSVIPEVPEVERVTEIRFGR